MKKAPSIFRLLVITTIIIISYILGGLFLQEFLHVSMKMIPIFNFMIAVVYAVLIYNSHMEFEIKGYSKEIAEKIISGIRCGYAGGMLGVLGILSNIIDILFPLSLKYHLQLENFLIITGVVMGAIVTVLFFNFVAVLRSTKIRIRI